MSASGLAWMTLPLLSAMGRLSSCPDSEPSIIPRAFLFISLAGTSSTLNCIWTVQSAGDFDLSMHRSSAWANVAPSNSTFAVALILGISTSIAFIAALMRTDVGSFGLR